MGKCWTGIVLVFFVAVLAACGGSDGSTGSEQTGSSASSATTQPVVVDGDVCATVLDRVAVGKLADAQRILTELDHRGGCATARKVLEQRQAEAATAMQECRDAAGKAAADVRDPKLATAAATECGQASALGADVSEQLSKLLAPAPPTSGASAVRSGWEKLWGAAASAPDELGQLAVVVLLVGPVLSAVGAVVGRWRPKHSATLRRCLRKHALLRGALIGGLVVGVCGLIVGPGRLPWWAAAATVGVVVVVATVPVLAKLRNWRHEETGARSHRLPIVVVALILWALLPSAGILWVFSAIAVACIHIAGESTRGILGLIAGGLMVAAAGWISAQRATLAFDTFTGVDGADAFGPLVATELHQLAHARTLRVDVVDSAASAASAAVSSSSVETLAGEANKVLAAVVGVLRAVFVPGTTYTVSGQLLPNGGEGNGVAVQLKAGRRTIDAASIFADRFWPPSASGEAADEKVDGKDKKATDEKTTPYVDLAAVAAIWLLVELIHERDGDSGDDSRQLTSQRWRSVALEHAGSVLVRRGELARARTAYAQAIDQDGQNAAARLGLATTQVRLSSGQNADAYEAREQIIDDVAEDPKQPGSVQNAAQYSRIAIRLNKLEKAGTDPDSDQKTELGRWLESYQELEVSSESMPERDALVASLELFVNDNGNKDDLREKAETSLRGRYNLAAFYVSRGDENRAKPLLTEALALPTLNAFARTDPYFEPVRNKSWFKDLLREGAAASGSPGPADHTLGAIYSIGPRFAERLEHQGVGSFDALATVTDDKLDGLGAALEVPRTVVEMWRSIAAIVANTPVGPVWANRLALLGITTQDGLNAAIDQSPTELARRLSAVARAQGGRSPSAEKVRTWRFPLDPDPVES